MGRYRKKPVEIEARQFTEQTAESVAAWCGSEVRHQPVDDGPYGVVYETTMQVTTIHGDEATVRVGDWVAEEPMPGRFYPINAEVFDRSYEPVDK